MPRTHFSGSLVALALTAALLAAGAANATALSARNVGEIFVDAAGRASGQNLATSIAEADGLIEGFHSLGSGTEVFSTIKIDGFAAAEKIQGVGTSGLTLKGSNAVVSLHDNLHSIVKIVATQPTAITYTLGPDVTATQEGAHGGIVRIAHATRGELGSLIAFGAEGPESKGESFLVKPGVIVARVQSGSEIDFLGKPSVANGEEYQRALVDATAQGALASHYVTEFEASDVRTSQVDHGALASVRTASSSAGSIASSVRAISPRVLAYDLAYETLPANDAGDVALYVDGELAHRVATPSTLLRASGAAYHAIVQNGRAQILAAIPSGDHRVTVTASAQASTEPQGRAEESGDDDARVYGSFEYHANGKLTGDFLTGVIPDGHSTLLSFTELASRTEVLKSLSIDGGARATFHSRGSDEMLLEGPKADLTLVDDVHATLMLVAKAPVDATFELASDITARPDGSRVLMLDGPRGPAGALALTSEDSSISASADGRVQVHLLPGDRILYRGEPDQHESEPAVLRALADGRVGAQLLAGIQDGALATKATAYADGIATNLRPAGPGMILVEYAARDDAAPRAFVMDARGAALAAKSASDIRITIDGQDATPVFTPEEALEVGGIARYYAMTSADGALRIIVNTASAAGTTASILVASSVESAAHANAHTDAFGAFRLFHDGTAVGSFVTLKADQAAGAVSGFSMITTSQPVFASLVAGHSPYVSVGGDGSSVLKLENRESRAEFSDTTSGFAKIVALEDTDAAFRLAGDLRAEARGANVVEIVTAAGQPVGSLIIAGATEASAFEMRGAQDVRAHLAQGAELLFRAHAGIESELSTAQRTMINQAIAGGRIAGQVIVQSQSDIIANVAQLERTARSEGNGVVISAREAFGEITSSVTASYGAVSVLTAATKQRVEITVGSATEAGKTLLVSLDPETIPGMADGHAIIKFDGKVVGQASSYADILDPTDDNDEAEYFVLAGEAGTQVLVSIPHFSVHTVTLEQKEDHPNSLYMYASLFLGLLVVVESALLARGHQRKSKINTRRP